VTETPTSDIEVLLFIFFGAVQIVCHSEEWCHRV